MKANYRVRKYLYHFAQNVDWAGVPTRGTLCPFPSSGPRCNLKSKIVIPAQAGIHVCAEISVRGMDSRLRGNDGKSRFS